MQNETDKAERPVPKLDHPLPRLSMRSTAALGVGYVLVYMALDRLSFLHPFGTIGITAWNPQTGLSFAMVLAFGQRLIPWLICAPLASDLVLRKVPPSLTLEVIVALIIGSVYALATWLLTRPSLAIDASLRSHRDLLRLMGTAAAAVLLVAGLCVALLVSNGYLRPDQSPRAVLRYWVGDFIGITIATPFLLLLFSGRRLLPGRLEAFAAVLAMALALYAVFGLGDVNRFQLFYLLFVPVIWMAVRFGLEGVSPFLMLAQLSLVGAIQYSGQSSYNVTDFQTLMLVLALTGLTMGAVVSEARQRQRALWLHREALARATRVGGMGELAAALAHEINQPLTAIGNYVRVVRHAVEQPQPEIALAREMANKAAQQVERAGAVVRRLRDFIHAGSNEPEVISLPDLVERTAAMYRAEFEQHRIGFISRLDKDQPPVFVDPLQIEQVVVNVLRNSIDAITEAGRADGEIIIDSRIDQPDRIKVCIRDNGPGFDAALLQRDITPFTTTKANGMGLGLSLSTSIIAAHGGALTIGGDGNGAEVCFTLPIAGQAIRAEGGTRDEDRTR